MARTAFLDHIGIGVPDLAAGDYGHGSAHIWSEGGHLMATASQTASMIRFDPTQPPPWTKA